MSWPYKNIEQSDFEDVLRLVENIIVEHGGILTTVTEENEAYYSTSGLIIKELVKQNVFRFRDEFVRVDALLWIEKNKDHLANLRSKPDDDYVNALVEKLGPDMAQLVVEQLSRNMYEICLEKADKVGNQIDRMGPMYKDFETAKLYYEKHGKVAGTTKDIVEFNDLMEFIYIGRRIKETDVEKLPDDGLILNRIVWIYENSRN